VHTPRYVRALRRGSGVSEALEFPELGQIHADRLLSAVVMPHLLACGGTVLAARLSASHPVAVNLGGGYHHAMPDRGEGFCLVADIAVAVRAVQADCSVGRTLVIDLDVHQGNGTALIFADDETVFTFSMHQADIYPIPKEFSDWDVELESGMKDIQYLALLEKNLPEVFNLARPDVVFFQAGCDVLAGDPLAGLALTEGGVVRRDWMVVEHCLRRNVPVVMTLGGGYARDSWRVQAESIKNLLQKC
jgi:histone deacetylase 11